MSTPLGRGVAAYAGVLGVALGVSVCIHWIGANAYEAARKHYVQSARAQSAAVAERAQENFTRIYESLRTLASLPSVRNIDRHGRNLASDGRETIQQVYNNLANSISVSEVYIVPVDLDPDRVDPETGKSEEPILMFDQLIVNAGRFANIDNPFDKTLHTDEPKSGPPEIEDFEYHQLKGQLAWLKRQVPNASAIRGLDYPVISGPEVITCDNTTYANSLKDADRSGVLFSVPFYGDRGELKGTVTAIVLTNAIRKWLPAQNYALLNTAYGYAAPSLEDGQQSASAAWVAKGEADPGLIFSDVRQVATADAKGQWALWSGAPDAVFTSGLEAGSVKMLETGAYAAVALLTVAGLICTALARRNWSLIRTAKAALEQRVIERTAQIHHIATHDALTGLPNRTLMTERIDESLLELGPGQRLALHCLDLDHFKSINDTLGHGLGDELLRAAAARISECLSALDTVCRLGGDEFVIIQAGVNDPQEAGALARRIIEAIAAPFELNGHQVTTGASIGIAVAPDDGRDRDLLLRSADMALYRAKADGRGSCRYFEPAMDIRLQHRRRMEIDLRRALTAQEFVLYYQPLVDSKSGEVTGFEALLRWAHPEKGLVPPGEFIPLAEEIGVIAPLGLWVIRKACQDAASWPEHISVAVNLSPVQFKTQTLLPAIVAALGTSGLAPSRLELEITESLLLTNSEATMANLHQLRALGVRIVMDDFGTGYSSLSYLRSFPFDKIKIDRSFVRDLGETPDCAAIVKAVTGLGVSLGIATTAEGVETAEQLEILREQGCSQYQGYFFGKPKPYEEATKLIEAQRRAVA